MKNFECFCRSKVNLFHEYIILRENPCKVFSVLSRFCSNHINMKISKIGVPHGYHLKDFYENKSCGILNDKKMRDLSFNILVLVKCKI